MRKINKGTEPRAWKEYRMTPGVVYQAIPELRSALLKEQGYLCAYCMRRIPVRDNNSNEETRIDHVQSRKNHTSLSLDYRNMVVCCPGAMGDQFHCDKSKGDRDMSFSVFSEQDIDTLQYSSKDGSIKSTNDIYNKEINDILNLNNPLLKKNRESTLRGVILSLNRKRSWKRSEIRTLLEVWQSKDAKQRYKPYSGIVIYFLNRKLLEVR